MPDFTYFCLWYMLGSWTAQLVQVVHNADGLTLLFFDTAGAVQTTWSFPRTEPAYWRWLFWALQDRLAKASCLAGKHRLTPCACRMKSWPFLPPCSLEPATSGTRPQSLSSCPQRGRVNPSFAANQRFHRSLWEQGSYSCPTVVSCASAGCPNVRCSPVY